MCGIVGIAGDINQKEKKMFRDMLLFDVVRGQDSTGVLSVPTNPNEDPVICKDIGAPQNLWEVGQFHKEFDYRGVPKGFSKVLLGHNRAATMGAVNVDNAHPFNFGDLYGVHNGSLINTHGLEGNHVVDSKCIYQTIHDKGIDHCWKNLFGAAALVWWDDGAGTLNMIRNDERPLFVAWSKDKKTLFWASELWMIRIAAMRNKVDLEVDNQGLIVQPESLPLNTLRSFKVWSTSVNQEEDRELENFQVSKTYTIGNAHGYTGHAGFKPANKEKDKEAPINTKWAAGLPKADKEDRGRAALVRFCARLYLGTSGGSESHCYYVVASLEGSGERVEIYPETLRDYEKWEAIKNSAGLQSEVKVRLKARPRLKKDKNGLRILCISTKYIELIHVKKAKSSTSTKKAEVHNLNDEIPFGGDEEEKTYRAYGGEKVTKEELQSQIRQAGGACLGCDDVLTTDDHEEIEWCRSDTMLCKNCSADPYIVNYLHG